MKKKTVLVILSITFSLGLKAQMNKEWQVGANQHLIASCEIEGSLVLTTQEEKNGELQAKTIRIWEEGKAIGPFEAIEQREILHQEDVELPQQSYLQLTQKGKQYVYYRKKMWGPFTAPELVKVAGNKLVFTDRKGKSSTYSIWRDGEKAEKEFESKKYSDVLTGISISEGGEVLLIFEKEGVDIPAYFIYKEEKHEGFYSGGIHLKGWLKQADGTFDPVVEAVAVSESSPSGDVNLIYIGNKMMARTIAILYEFEFKADASDFVFRAYTEANDGARIYTSKAVYGPYKSAFDLDIDSLQQISFLYEQNNTWYSWVDGKTSQASKNPNDGYKEFAPDGVDYLLIKDGEEGETSYTWKNQEIVRDSMANVRFLRWSSKHGPVLLESLLKPYDPSGNPELGMVPAGSRLYLGAKATEVYDVICDVTESPLGELAYAVKKNNLYYIHRGDKQYGPYQVIYTYGNERGSFLKWSEDGKKLIYNAIEVNRSQVFQDGKAEMTIPGIMRMYWNETKEQSAIMIIKDMKCFVNSDFYEKRIDDDLPGWEMEAQIQEELNQKMPVMQELKNCVSLYWNGKEYENFTFLRDVHYHLNGSAISFKNFDDPILIWNQERYNGMVEGKNMVYYQDGKIIIRNL